MPDKIMVRCNGAKRGCKLPCRHSVPHKMETRQGGETCMDSVDCEVGAVQCERVKEDTQ